MDAASSFDRPETDDVEIDAPCVMPLKAVIQEVHAILALEAPKKPQSRIFTLLT